MFIRSHTNLSGHIKDVIDKITKNPFNRSLKTHKLSGQLGSCFASSITRVYRIVFTLNEEEICFVDIGSHDEVY